jgi:hypothetical protein
MRRKYRSRYGAAKALNELNVVGLNYKRARSSGEVLFRNEESPELLALLWVPAVPNDPGGPESSNRCARTDAGLLDDAGA